MKVHVVGSTNEDDDFHLVASTKEYIILRDHHGSERCYRRDDGKSIMGTDWYHIPKRDIPKVNAHLAVKKKKK